MHTVLLQSTFYILALNIGAKEEGRELRIEGCARKRVNSESFVWWLVANEVYTRRWSGQLPHYIPNRKRDKANKTLSGRRSANTAASRERGVRRRTKTWNKSPHFCSLESFSNYGRDGVKGGGGKEDASAERGSSVIYISPRFRNY